MASSVTCYCKHSDDVFICPSVVPNYPCSNDTSSVQQCCATGDTCGADGFCHFTHPSQNDLSGFYMGGCTDPSFKDAKCAQQCTDHPTQDVIFNSTTSLWSCCYGSGSLDCGVPSNETFQAPPPENILSSSTSAATSSSTSLTSSTSASASEVAASTAASAPSPALVSSSLNTGAQAGIGVGVSLASLVLIAGLVFFSLRRRRRARGSSNTNEGPSVATGWQKNLGAARQYKMEHSGDRGEARELPGSAYRRDERPSQYRGELDGTTARSELPGEGTALR